MISGRKIHASEKSVGSEKSLLDRFREELEGLHVNTSGVARRTSALARIRKLRSAYVQRVSVVFYKRDFSGVIRFMPSGGKRLLAILFNAR